MNTVEKIKQLWPNLELLPAQIKLIEEMERGVIPLSVTSINSLGKPITSLFTNYLMGFNK